MKFIFEIIKLVVFLWIVQQLLWVGSTWDIMTHPIKNVEVILEDGSRHKGEYSRDWSRNHILNIENGKTISFNEFKTMSFPAEQNDKDRSRWRMYTPASLFSLIWIAVLLFNFQRKKKLHHR